MHSFKSECYHSKTRTNHLKHLNVQYSEISVQAIFSKAELWVFLCQCHYCLLYG